MLRLRALLAVTASTLVVGCASRGVPDPKAAAQAYAKAAQDGDADALYAMMTESSQRSLGREGTQRAVADARDELREQAAAVTGPGAETKQIARARFADGEEATLSLEDGAFRITSADALPAGARTPAQALDQLRRVLARRSYAGLMRVLSKETRASMERDLRTLVEGLERPEGLDVKVTGDRATVQITGGHVVRLRREGGLWTVDDFDLAAFPAAGRSARSRSSSARCWGSCSSRRRPLARSATRARSTRACC